MTILRAAMITLLLAVSAHASVILMSGGADAAADWDVSGMTLQVGGQGIGVNAFLYNGPSQGCYGNCDFGGSVGPRFAGYSYGYAASPDLSTGNFYIDLSQSNPDGELDGVLELCQPTYTGACYPGEPGIAESFNIKTFLASETTTTGPGAFSETVYIFSSTPEPTFWPVMLALLGFPLLLRRIARVRARPRF